MLSILIPNYNGEKVLPQFFPSVLKSVQSYKGSFEVIVVDDGSTDKSIEYLKPFHDEGKIKLHIHEKNKGFSGACNTAASLAQGEILFFLNTDVELGENFFDHFEKYFQNDNTFAVTAYGIQYRTGKNLDGIKWGEWRRGQLRVTENIYPSDLAPALQEQILQSELGYLSFGVQGAYFFVSTKKFQALGGFDERLNPFIFEETDLCYRAMKRGWKIYFEPQCKARHDHSTTLNSVASKKRLLFFSFRNRLIFTWKNIHDVHLMTSHLFFLFLKLLTCSPVIWRAFTAALKMLPSILASRKIEKQQSQISDFELFQSFQKKYQKQKNWIQTITPVITTVVLFVMQSVLFRVFLKSTTEFTYKSFAIAVGFSLFFWLMLLELQKLLPYRGKLLFSIILSLVFSFYFITQFVTYYMFGEFVTSFMITYILNDVRYIADYILKYIVSPESILVFSVSFLFYQIWAPDNTQLYLKSKLPTVGRLVLFFILSVLFLNQIKWETSGQFKTADGALIASLDILRVNNKPVGLHVSVREKITPFGNDLNANNKLPPDIFLFIGESWGKEKTPFYGYDKNTMPHLQSWVQQNKALVFNNAFTNSSATDVSLPSLLTGVGTEQSAFQFHRMPLIWDWARAAGYQTIFVSSQRLVFGHIDHFFNTPGPDLYVPGNSISNLIINDQGIDDGLAALKLRELILQQSKDKPILVIFFNNALHFPFQDQSKDVIEFPNELTTKYEKALYITDHAIDTVLKAINERGRSTETLYLFTADHGEVETQTRNVPRIVSFYDEIISIPFIIKLPEQWKSCEAQMKLNQKVNIQNLDVLPTVVDLMKSQNLESHLTTEVKWNPFSEENNNQSYNNSKSKSNETQKITKDSKQNKNLYSEFRGESLCRPISENRILIHLNTNGVRQWSKEGFGLTMAHQKLIYSTLEGLYLFDLVHDRKNMHNILSLKQNDSQLKIFQNKINSEAELKRIIDSKPISDFITNPTAQRNDYKKHM